MNYELRIMNKFRTFAPAYKKRPVGIAQLVRVSP